MEHYLCPRKASVLPGMLSYHLSNFTVKSTLKDGCGNISYQVNSHKKLCVWQCMSVSQELSGESRKLINPRHGELLHSEAVSKAKNKQHNNRAKFTLQGLLSRVSYVFASEYIIGLGQFAFLGKFAWAPLILHRQNENPTSPVRCFLHVMANSFACFGLVHPILRKGTCMKGGSGAHI